MDRLATSAQSATARTVARPSRRYTELRADGWVTWDDGRDSTLRPLVRVVAHTPREHAGQGG